MTTPKFTQIKQFIFEQIESGTWSEHQRVPSENELASQFGVSRMTARRALQELTDEGVLSRSKGSGTFVASFKSQSSLMEIRNIADEVKAAGHTYSAKPVGIEKLLADAAIAIELDIAIGDSVYFSKILHMQNDQPIQLEQRFVNAALVPNYINQDFSVITPHEYLSKEAPLTEATHQIEAVLSEATITALLAIKAEQPCLQVKRRTWSSHGVVSLAILTSPGDKYRLGGHLKF
ncbi:histidine utilization repressor [Thalassotalea sp. ND16A]|uniref:histidine utilization repressor n=1 Tax=Thalassotalea sp. ND16A TaxID=1535422 RepID=UPI00051A680C|nr:histidine utilization repressor [Thalassotalea sp. ND16A]KGJ87903.1 putative transcriptional regulator, GntR family [Thalassotalea sp. ND16A]